MKLYYLPGACSLASHIALIWSGMPYELERLDFDSVHGPAFMELNPKGAVPALVLDHAARGNVILTESLAVLLYIAGQNPTAQLGPIEGNRLEQAKINEVLSELVSEVHKAFVPTFAPERFAVDEAAYDGARAAAFLMIDKAFRRLDGLLLDREWLVLERRTVADAYLHVMCRFKVNTPTSLADYPNLARHFRNLATDPGVIRALAEEGLPVSGSKTT